MISEELEKIIQNAFELAKKKHHEFLTLEHLLLELCKDKEVQELFKTFEVDVLGVTRDLNTFISKKLVAIEANPDVKPMPSSSFEKTKCQHIYYLLQHWSGTFSSPDDS